MRFQNSRWIQSYVCLPGQPFAVMQKVGGGGGKQTQLEQDCYYLYLERVETGTIPAEPASLVRQPLKSKIIEIYGYRKISSGVACTFTERVMWQLKIAKLAKR